MSDTPVQPWRILVVDDEPAVQLVLERLFGRMGHPVVAARSAPDGQAQLFRRWDLCLIDKNLPDGSGVELAKQVRERNPNAVIVLITGYASRESADALVGIVDEYITKPFELRHLREVLTALMEIRQKGAQVLGQLAPRPAPAGDAAGAKAQAPGGDAAGARAPAAGGDAAGARAPAPGGDAASARAPAPVARTDSVHIVVADAREEALLLGAARQVGLSAKSGPLGEQANPGALVVDGASATLALRKAVWLRQARQPPLRVALLVDESSVEDATLAVSLKATTRVKRPLTPESGAALMARLKG